MFCAQNLLMAVYSGTPAGSTGRPSMVPGMELEPHARHVP